ncbi:MAG TPA: PIN domain-containing protein [Stellaceae bacterium]|nr:PIN domain-containing protein [Stellaceae bacterium]
MIYIDASVALAYLLAEARTPPAAFWNARLVSSRLLEFEVWNRIHVRRPDSAGDGEVRRLLAGIQLIDMTSLTLARALEPFPLAVRTLDALHLATVDWLRSNGEEIELASYDNRMLAAARALGIALASL